MTSVRLDTLPPELIHHIACSTDAFSVLQLARVSRRLRSVCYDALVFSELLIAQQSLWTQKSLDLDAIAHRAGADVQAWARYALAEQRAWEFTRRQAGPDTSYSGDDVIAFNYIEWLPELSIVRHPFVNHDSWICNLGSPLLSKPCQLFSAAIAVVMFGGRTAQLSEGLRLRDNDWLDRGNDIAKTFRTFYATALILRVTERIRLEHFPQYTHNGALVRRAKLPDASKIPLRPLKSSYNIPLPFTSLREQREEPNEFSDPLWDEWYSAHVNALFHSTLFITEGSWCGYYAHFRGQAPKDPPMVNI